MRGCDDAAAPIIQAFTRCRLDAIASQSAPAAGPVPAFKLGDKVRITLPDWHNEPAHYVTAIDWHPKAGHTYTTSDVWPPKVDGLHVCGLTDGWLPDDLSAWTDA
jgi:hypothetical protein